MTEEYPTDRRTVLRTAAVTVGSMSALAGCLSAPTDVRSESSDFRSVTHVHYEAGTTVSSTTESTPQSPDPDEYVLQEGGVRWDSFPVETTVGIGTAPDGISESAARDAISAAFDAWNSVANVGAVFAPPTFDDSLTEVTAENGENEFVWTGLDDALGRATIYWDGETERLEEVDVKLSRELTWSTASDATDAFDVQSLVTHEVGHHGLDDVAASTASEQTMYHETATGSTKKRTLEAGDIAGWQAVYGGVT